MAAILRYDAGASPTSDSATDASEDSVEVKVQPVAMPVTPARRNKRKSSEPRKIKERCGDAEAGDGFAPARCRLKLLEDRRPPPPPPAVFSAAAVAESSGSDDEGDGDAASNNFLLNLPFDVRNILGPSAESLLQRRVHGLAAGGGGVGSLRDFESEAAASPPSSAGGDEPEATGGRGNKQHQQQRNYKNMTRERRIEANARERTRVHTISAAFEALRRAVPSYSCHQKLSKLAILRIACSYILALASLNQTDYSGQQDCPSFAECVELCSKTIQAEAMDRKRKCLRDINQAFVCTEFCEFCRWGRRST